jgi:hypothetical protein
MHRMSRSIAETRRTTVLPMLQIQEAMDRMVRGPVREVVRTLVLRRFEVHPLLDT